MKIPMHVVCLSFFVATAGLPAQEGEKAKPAQKQEKQDKQEPRKDDKITAKDPAIQAIDAFIKKQSVDQGKDGWKTTLSAPPKQQFDKNSDYFWHVETSAGSLKVRYLPEAAPMHVTSGIYLSRLGYYDGLGFHRIIPGFMAQGGCPNTEDPSKQRAWGTGGPGYFMDGEFVGNLKHDKPGLLSMANTGRPNSDGAQFFLTFVPTPWLDGKHTVWGEVVDGKDTLKALEKLGSPANNGMLNKPIKIERTWISVAPKGAVEEEKEEAAEPKKGGEPKKAGGGGK